MNTPEMQAIGHKTNYNVAVARDAVTKVFSSDKVKDAIRKKGIKLISYKDVKIQK